MSAGLCMPADMLILIGAFLFFIGLGFAIKVGLIVWIVSLVHRGAYPRPQNATQPAPKAPSRLDKLQKVLAVVSTSLGILTALVGLVGDCNPPYQDDRGPIIVPDTPRSQRLGHACCTPSGPCLLVHPGPVGMACTCLVMGGPLPGTVCK